MALINQTINGYTFTEFIGAGGFGSVYKANKDGNTYAIKVFREEYILQEYKQCGHKNAIQSRKGAGGDRNVASLFHSSAMRAAESLFFTHKIASVFLQGILRI